MYNCIDYTNKIGLTFSITDIQEFTWMKDKYKEIFIDDLITKNKILKAVGYVANSYDELLEKMLEDKKMANAIENLFVSVYSTYDDSITVISDIDGKILYKVTGSQLSINANSVDCNSIVDMLNPNKSDYTDVFGHEIKFHIYN